MIINLLVLLLVIGLAVLFGWLCYRAIRARKLWVKIVDVTGTDYSPAAIALGSERGAAAGVAVEWVEDDPTNLRHVRGPFDLLVDWGVYDDLSPPAAPTCAACCR